MSVLTTDAGRMLAGLLTGDVDLLDRVADQVRPEALTDPTIRMIFEAAVEYRRTTRGLVGRDAVLASASEAGTRAQVGELFDALTDPAGEAPDAAATLWHAAKVARAHVGHTVRRVLAETGDIASGSVTEEGSAGRPGRTWSGPEDAVRWLAARTPELVVLAGDEAGESAPSPPVPDPAMFHGILGEIVRAAEPTTEADPVGVLVSLMAGVSAFIGSDPHVQVGNTRHPLLVWSLLFGRTGSGRKGEATGTAKLFLSRCDGDTRKLTITGLSSGEGLIEVIRDKRGDDDSGGTEDKRLFVVEPEFAQVMARSGRQGNSLSTVLRQAWEGGPLENRIRDSVTASGSHIAVLGHITPGEFRRKMSESDMSGGLFNRLLPIYVERSKRLPIPEGVDEDTRRALTERLASAVTRAKTIRRITMNDAARDLWRNELYDRFAGSDDEDQLWTEFTRRGAPSCLRVAGLHAALRGSVLINAADLRAAAALIDYSVATAMFVLDRQTRDPRFDRLRRAVDAAGEVGMTRTEVSALFSRNISKADLDDLLGRLVSTRHATAQTDHTGGRPAQRYITTTPSVRAIPASDEDDRHDLGFGTEPSPEIRDLLADSAMPSDTAADGAA